MLGLTSTLGIETKFTDVSKSDSLHYSLLSLETYPPHVSLCLIFKFLFILNILFYVNIFSNSY